MLRSFLRGFLPVFIVALVVAIILGRLLLGAAHLEFGDASFHVVQMVLP